MEGNSNCAANTASANSAGITHSHIDDSVKWVVDTGSTNHMIGNKAVFQTSTLVDDVGKVQLPTGESANISHIGKCQFSGGNFIKNVLCVPTFKFNLLSVSKLTKELKCCAEIFPDFCLFQYLSYGKVRDIGKE